MAERFRFASDGDGHNYIIKAGQEEEFARWVEAGPYWDDWDGFNFNDCGIDGHEDWTFENPQEDE